jgi:GT2 family glycosyltransferase
MTLRQDYHDIEIIVVDDGTPGQEIADAVKDFITVQYLRTPKNIGLIAARNFGATHCTGEFIINLDDDSWLEDDNDITKIVDFMNKNPKCGVAALNIGLDQVGYLWPRESPYTQQRTYKGCGNVYRHSIISTVGGYIPEFFRQGEEVERSLRIMDAGYDIIATPDIRVFHAQSNINRNWPKHLAFEAANYLRRELIRAPWWLLPLGLTRAARWAFRNRLAMDRQLYMSEVFGKRVPLIRFMRKYRAPVRTRTYFRAMRLS